MARGIQYVTKESLKTRTKSWMSQISYWLKDASLPDLNHCALLVIDLQQFFYDPQSHAYVPALEAILPNIKTWIDHFRAKNRPIVFTRQGATKPTIMNNWWKDELQKGETRAELINEICPNKNELVLDKEHYSAFKDTNLAQWLSQKQCNKVIICGVTTHLCCDTTARDAFMLGIQPVIVADGCATWDEDLHLGSLRNLANGFATIVTTDQLGDNSSLKPEKNIESIEIEHSAPYDLVIIGAGPAGIAAAIQAKRNGLDLLLVDPDLLGGQARTANWIENYPGFPGGISGQDLMRRFCAQIDWLEIKQYCDSVVAISQNSDKTFFITFEKNQEKICANAVILATGTEPRCLGIEGEQHVVYRVDALSSIRNKRIVIVGGGEAAFDQALLAHRMGAKYVAIIVRKNKPKAMQRLVEQAANCNTTMFFSTDLRKIVTRDNMLTLHLQKTSDSEKETFAIDADAVVICVGKKPKIPKLPLQLSLTETGIPQTDIRGRTNIEGLYLAGDIRQEMFRQVAIAVADGLTAAMHVSHYLTSKQWKP